MSSAKTYLLSLDTLKTMGQGALGAMTFGAYHQYTTNKIMELNNEKMALQNKYFIDQQKQEMNELNGKIDKMEKDRKWW
jgi:TolA-binding protein